jgi:peptide/nickel transport system substrate-binding protein
VTDIKWHVINDRATAVAALQNNEVDGIEAIDNDFLPILRKDKAITLIKSDLPSIAIMRFNHLHPPFDNILMRRAILAVVNQTEYMTAANGSEFPEYWNDKVGVWAPGTPMATTAGLDKLTGKRDFALARSLIKQAGYNGQAIVLLDPVDSPTHHASALVTADLFKKLDLKVDLRSMDWGSYLQRRNSQDPPASGGWKERTYIKISHNTPMATCVPCVPVRVKKVVPNMLLVIVIFLISTNSWNSNTWQPRKIEPKKMVVKIDQRMLLMLPF